MEDFSEGRTTSRTNKGETSTKKVCTNLADSQQTVKKTKLVRPLFKVLQKNSISKIVEKRQISKEVKERYGKSKNSRYPEQYGAANGIFVATHDTAEITKVNIDTKTQD